MRSVSGTKCLEKHGAHFDEIRTGISCTQSYRTLWDGLSRDGFSGPSCSGPKGHAPKGLEDSGVSTLGRRLGRTRLY